MGRVPQALLMALQLNAEVIVIGSGASVREFVDSDPEKTRRVLREAEFTLEFLKLHFDSLKNFPAWKHWLTSAGQTPHFQSDEAAWDSIKERLLDRIIIDVDAQKTIDELKNAGLIFSQRGIDQVVLVTSPTHLPRVVRDACVAYQDGEEPLFSRVLGVPSCTNFPGATADDVMVLEPPHRPDRTPSGVLNPVRRLMRLQSQDVDELRAVAEELNSIVSHAGSSFSPARSS